MPFCSSFFLLPRKVIPHWEYFCWVLICNFTNDQVHVSVVGSDKIRVTWITDDDDALSTVDFGTSSGQYPFSATGSSSTYSYLLYRSGHIHDVVIGPLDPNTVYYYRCSSNPAREFSFKTPPPNLPMKFAVVGMLISLHSFSASLFTINCRGCMVENVYWYL